MLVFTLLAALACVLAVSAAFVARALRAGGRRQDTIGSDDARAASRFTIPVSLIVTADTSSDRLSETVSALLNLHYPELEVIAVVDGANRDLLSSLVSDWKLEAREFFFRRSLQSGTVRRIYHSGRDERLMVVDLPSNGRADALNCAVSIARYRYVGIVPAGITFDSTALLRMMTAPLRDPSSVLGVSAHIEGARGTARLRSIRTLSASLLIWRHRRSAPPPDDAVIVWRRDALLEIGGFSPLAADLALDVMRRLLLTRSVNSGRFYRSGERFGRWSHAGGRATVRRVLGVLQFVRVLTPAGIRAFSAGTLALFFLSELALPLAEAWLIVGTTLAAALGAVGWWSVLAAVGVVLLARASVSAAALLTRGSVLDAPDSTELRGLIARSAVEPLMFGR